MLLFRTRQAARSASLARRQSSSVQLRMLKYRTVQMTDGQTLCPCRRVDLTEFPTATAQRHVHVTVVLGHRNNSTTRFLV